MADECLFCRIARGELPVPLVAETDECVAFADIDPQAPVHLLVVPRAHIESLDAARDAGVLGDMLLLAADVARREGIAAAGYRTVINTHAAGGQTVPHIHAHIMGGRRFQWPPG